MAEIMSGGFGRQNTLDSTQSMHRRRSSHDVESTQPDLFTDHKESAINIFRAAVDAERPRLAKTELGMQDDPALFTTIAKSVASEFNSERAKQMQNQNKVV